MCGLDRGAAPKRASGVDILELARGKPDPFGPLKCTGLAESSALTTVIATHSNFMGPFALSWMLVFGAWPLSAASVNQVRDPVSQPTVPNGASDSTWWQSGVNTFPEVSLSHLEPTWRQSAPRCPGEFGLLESAEAFLRTWRVLLQFKGVFNC